MQRPALWMVSCAVFGISVDVAAAEERMTICVTFEQATVDPGAACDGEFTVSGGRIAMQEWLHDTNDTVNSVRYRLSTEHDARSAAAVKGVVRRSALPKGPLLEVAGGSSATLYAVTKLGNFEVPFSELRNQHIVTVLDGKAQLQWLPNVSALTGNEAEEEYPSIVVLPNGQTAVAYVAWDGREDAVYLRQGDRVQQVTSRPGDYMEPRCGVDGSGRLWIVWAAGNGQCWDLWASCEGKQTRLTHGRYNSFWPRLTKDRYGNLWLAWQTVADDLRYEIMLARLDDEGLTAPINVSQHEASDWEPALCATADGRLVVAWDTYRNGSDFAWSSPIWVARPE